MQTMQAGHLPLLAPVLPSRPPTLAPAAYDAVAASLLEDPALHPRLLSLVQAWPAGLYSQTSVIDGIAQRMRRPGGDTRELWQALALLYKAQGRTDLSLAIFLQLQLPGVFDFIKVSAGCV